MLTLDLDLELVIHTYPCYICDTRKLNSVIELFKYSKL